LTLTALAPAACHNLSDEPVESGVVPADLRIGLRVSATGTDRFDIDQSIRARLVESGFEVVDEAALAVVAVDVDMTKDADTQVPLLGTVAGSYRFHVSVTLLDAASQAPLHRFTLERTHGDPRFTMKDAGHVVARIRKSEVLPAHAQRLLAEARERQARERDAEAAAWRALDLDACRNATRPEDCEAVAAYVVAHRDGPHVAEALAARVEGGRSLAAAEAERVWQALPTDACRSPKRSTDCAAVEGFLVMYPTAARVPEARALLARTEGRRAALAEQERARAEALARKEDAEAKREYLAECLRECRRSYERYRDFETLVARCYQTECVWED